MGFLGSLQGVAAERHLPVPGASGQECPRLGRGLRRPRVCPEGAPSLGEAAPEATHRGVRWNPRTLQALEPLSPLPPMLPSRGGATGERHGGRRTLKTEPRSTCAIFFILILFTLFVVVGVLAASLYRAPPLNRALC